MTGLYLTREEKEMLEHQREMAQENNDLDLYLRTNAVLLVSEGRMQREVAETLHVPLRTLEWWIERYRTIGINALVKGPYPGRTPRLTSEQRAELAEIIKAGPEEAGLQTGVWTGVVVKSLVKVRFGVDYGVSQVRRILRKIGFSLQVPRRKPAKEDPEQQKQWEEKDLPEIKKQVLTEGGLEVYQDEASFRQSGSVTHTWCPTGEGCAVKGSPIRKSVRVLGAVVVGPEPKWHFRFADKFNGDSFVALLKQLVRRYRGTRIHLITDNVAYHKSPLVRDWLETQDDITIHYLPKYSPQFNATEYVWRKAKRWTTHNRYFETIQELKSELFRRFNRFQGNPASLRSSVAPFL